MYWSDPPSRPSRGGADRNIINRMPPADLAVAPHAGARIETRKPDALRPLHAVAPHAGARIETMSAVVCKANGLRSPLTRGRGSKPVDVAEGVRARGSPLTRGRGSKLVEQIGHAVDEESPLTRGRGSKRSTRSAPTLVRCRPSRGGADRNWVRPCMKQKSPGRPSRGGADRNYVAATRPTRALVSPLTRGRGSKPLPTPRP